MEALMALIPPILILNYSHLRKRINLKTNLGIERRLISFLFLLVGIVSDKGINELVEAFIRIMFRLKKV